MADVDDIMTKCGTNAAECKDICEKGLGAFDKFDADGSGYLTRDEIAALLKAGNSKMSAKTVCDFCDLDQNNKVSKEEFIKGLVCTHIEDDIRRVFNDFDKDNSGQIDKQELGAISGACEEKGIHKGSLSRVMAKYDEDKSGGISFEEFKEAFFSK